VAGKMFPTGCNTGLLQLLDDHATQLGDHVRCLAERAVPDYRIFRIRVDIEHRRIVQGDPNCQQLRRQSACKLAGEGRIITSTEGGHRRPLCERRPESRHAPTFLIDANPSWQLDAEAPQVVCELRDLPWGLDVSQPSKEGDPAKIELASERPKLNRYVGSMEATDKELTDAAAKRLRRHDLSL
jgi:hypothetical protein